jgi:hypothetical protein
MSSNPIIRLELRRKRHPSPRLTAALAIAFWAASLIALRSSPEWITSQEGVSFVARLQPVIFFGVLLSPLVTASIVAIAMARTMDGQQFELLRQSTLPDSAVVRGYAVTTLYQLRLMLLLIAGAVPLLAFKVERFYGGGNCSMGPLCFGLRMPSLGDLFATLPVLAWVAGLHVFGAALSVGLVLRWKKLGLMFTLAMIVSVPVWVALRAELGVALFRGIDWPYGLVGLRHLISQRGPSTAVTVAAIILTPYLLGAGCMRIVWRAFGERRLRRAAEMASVILVAAALLIADPWAVRMVAERKGALVAQMGSPDHEEALEAAQMLRSRGWLQDGTLALADLSGARLEGANLQNADLRSARLLNADLEGVDLRGADLTRANLTGANLQGALLQGAILEATVPPTDQYSGGGDDWTRFTDPGHPDFWRGI